MAELSPADRHKSHDMGLHAEQLAGRTQQVFFYPEEGDNYTYPEGFDVDFTKKATIDAAEMDGPAVNLRIPGADGRGLWPYRGAEPAGQALPRRWHPQSPEARFRGAASATSAAA